MIVEGEGFLSRLVVNHNRSQCWIRLKDSNKVVPQPPFELAGLGNAVTPDDLLIVWATDQLAIIQRSQWIAFRQTRDLSILMIGRDQDVIGLVEYVAKTI